MKLIIDIPEKDYNEICKDYFLNDDIYTAIKNGIPLEQIRAEIKNIRDNGNLTKIPYFYVGRCLQIIDRHSKGDKQC